MASERTNRVPFESAVVLLAAAAVTPWIVSLLLLMIVPGARQAAALMVLLSAVTTSFLLLRLRERVTFPLRSLAGLLASMREGEYTSGLAEHDGRGALAEAVREANLLAARLRGRREAQLDAAALLRAVATEIDAALFVFGPSGELKLANAAACRLLRKPLETMVGRDLAELEIHDLTEAGDGALIDRTFPGGAGRWSVRRRRFREAGAPHEFLVVTDLSRALREEERQAWSRLLRVLTHELKNSLTPIATIAAGLERKAMRQPDPATFAAEVRRGLELIAARTAALDRFIGSYGRLARLPEPRLARVAFAPLLRRTAAMETRREIQIVPGEEVFLQGDADQLEQLLINLIRNAVDAAGREGEVSIRWIVEGGVLCVGVLDEGPGVGDGANLFVPFYTTKPEGSGIGLVLSRRIAENHGGTLTLSNRRDGQGCEARLTLPVEPDVNDLSQSASRASRNRTRQTQVRMGERRPNSWPGRR
ncbi:MAG TPA: ATP-binding protein [Thermoanaerobaculia bacterium]